MAIPLKQSTAVTIKLGPFVDATDGVTNESGLTISQADIRLSKNGGNIAQTNNSAGATYDEVGFYDVPLDTTDTNTLGTLDVIVNESGALHVWARCVVLPANVYDSMFSTDKIEVDVVQWNGSNVASPASAGYPAVTLKVGTGTGEVNLSSGKAPATIAAGDLAANSVTASALAADAVDEILDDTIGDGTITVRQALRIAVAGIAGKLSGAATTTVTIRNAADSADVIVATVDANGNRSAVTVTP